MECLIFPEKFRKIFKYLDIIYSFFYLFSNISNNKVL